MKPLLFSAKAIIALSFSQRIAHQYLVLFSQVLNIESSDFNVHAQVPMSI